MDIEKLKPHLPESVFNELPDTIKNFNITNTLRLCHFLAQCSHESGNFTRTKENLNYSEERLLQVFPKYFTKDNADDYANKPDKIASRVYANRMGNGDEKSQDGYKYSGRGYIQLTGKNNYKALSRFVGEDLLTTPALVATKYPLASAAFFFNSNNIWSVCDKGSDKNTITKVSKIVNGGTIGLEERISLFNKYFKIMN